MYDSPPVGGVRGGFLQKGKDPPRKADAFRPSQASVATENAFLSVGFSIGEWGLSISDSLDLWRLNGAGFRHEDRG